MGPESPSADIKNIHTWDILSAPTDQLIEIAWGLQSAVKAQLLRLPPQSARKFSMFGGWALMPVSGFGRGSLTRIARYYIAALDTLFGRIIDHDSTMLQEAHERHAALISESIRPLCTELFSHRHLHLPDRSYQEAMASAVTTILTPYFQPRVCQWDCHREEDLVSVKFQRFPMRLVTGGGWTVHIQTSGQEPRIAPGLNLFAWPTDQRCLVNLNLTRAITETPEVELSLRWECSRMDGRAYVFGRSLEFTRRRGLDWESARPITNPRHYRDHDSVMPNKWGDITNQEKAELIVDYFQRAASRLTGGYTTSWHS